MTAKLLQRKPIQATTEAEDLALSKRLGEQVAEKAKKELGTDAKVQGLGPGIFEVKAGPFTIRGLHRDDKMNLKVDGPKGTTIGEHSGTMAEVTKALGKTFNKSADASDDDAWNKKLDNKAIAEVQVAVNNYVKGLLSKLYVQTGKGTQSLKEYLNGRPITELFTEEAKSNATVGTMARRLQQEAKKFVDEQKKGNVFKAKFSENSFQWFAKKIITAKCAKLLQKKARK
jgi:hypothetical protein